MNLIKFFISFIFLFKIYSCRPLLPYVGTYHYYTKIVEEKEESFLETLNSTGFNYQIDTIDNKKCLISINDFVICDSIIVDVVLVMKRVESRKIIRVLKISDYVHRHEYKKIKGKYRECFLAKF